MSLNWGGESRQVDTARPRFWMDTAENKERSAEEGRPVFDPVEMVEIVTPGDRLTSWIGEVQDKHRARFAKQYEDWKRGQQRAVSGTPLEEWPPLSVSRVAELKAQNILTVEEYAAVPDNVLQKLGMGARAERDKARAWLDEAKGHAANGALAAENAELKRRLEALEQQMLTAPQPTQQVEPSAQHDEPSTQRDKSIEQCTDDELKAYIKRETGEGVRGQPTRDTLIKRASEIATGGQVE